MSVRRMVAEPNTALAGGKLEIFTVFRASMASFSAEVAPSRLLGCWDSTVSMVKTRGSYERTVRRQGFEEDSEP